MTQSASKGNANKYCKCRIDLESLHVSIHQQPQHVMLSAGIPTVLFSHNGHPVQIDLKGKTSHKTNSFDAITPQCAADRVRKYPVICPQNAFILHW